MKKSSSNTFGHFGTAIKKTHALFLWRLIVNETELTTYVCQFVAGSLSYGERDGKVYSVSFGLRLKPNYTGKDFNETIIVGVDPQIIKLTKN